jgi:phosphoenolpyruvate carboxykinase (GTP)
VTSNEILKQWVKEVSELTRPDNIHWCTGSAEENKQLIDGMLETGDFIELNQDKNPNCYLHRSDPSDVARVEHLTFICTSEEEDAGPNNLWMDPVEWILLKPRPRCVICTPAVCRAGRFT